MFVTDREQTMTRVKYRHLERPAARVRSAINFKTSYAAIEIKIFPVTNNRNRAELHIDEHRL